MKNDFKPNPNRIKNLNMNCTHEEGWEIVDKFGKQAWEEFKKIDFPYPTYSLEELKNEWNSLVERPGELNSKASSKIITSLHRSLYDARRGDSERSPREFWDYIKTDYEVFKKFYFNRLTRSDWFKKDDRKDTWMRQGKVPTRIYFVGMTSSMMAPRVSFFKPSLAKYIVEKYLKQYDTIFDPCAGYAGRMLGTLACNKKYIGMDINQTTITESKNIFDTIVKSPMDDFFGGYDVDLDVADLFANSGNYDCLFTCTPYGLKEVWNENETDLSCDGWIEAILDRYKCKEYVFVVDETEKFKDHIVESISNEAHFSKNCELILKF